MADSYAFTCDVLNFIDVEAEAVALEAELRLAGNAVGADRAARAVATLKVGLAAMSANVAALGTEILRRHERDSRLRPDSLCEGGERLGDHLVCDPIFPLGSVGIANESELDAEVPWWATNEQGSSALVGRVLYGVFQPGGEAPDSGQFRQHPIFEPGPAKGSPSGRIRNPIPARRFVEHAIPEIEALWLAEFRALKAAYAAEITAARVP